MYHHDLDDLLNSNAAAYRYFYSLTPGTQELLRSRSICSLDQLRREAADVTQEDRPDAL